MGFEKRKLKFYFWLVDLGPILLWSLNDKRLTEECAEVQGISNLTFIPQYPTPATPFVVNFCQQKPFEMHCKMLKIHVEN